MNNATPALSRPDRSILVNSACRRITLTVSVRAVSSDVPPSRYTPSTNDPVGCSAIR